MMNERRLVSNDAAGCTWIVLRGRCLVLCGMQIATFAVLRAVNAHASEVTAANHGVVAGCELTPGQPRGPLLGSA